MPSKEQGQADHRALELFERMAGVAEAHGTTIERFRREATEEILVDAAKRFWERRGYYHVQEVDRVDRIESAGEPGPE